MGLRIRGGCRVVKRRKQAGVSATGEGPVAARRRPRFLALSPRDRATTTPDSTLDELFSRISWDEELDAIRRRHW